MLTTGQLLTLAVFPFALWGQTPTTLKLEEVRVRSTTVFPGFTATNSVAQAGNQFTVTINQAGSAGSGSVRFTVDLPNPATSYLGTVGGINFSPRLTLTGGLTVQGTGEAAGAQAVVASNSGVCPVSSTSSSRTFTCLLQNPLPVENVNGRSLIRVESTVGFAGSFTISAYYSYLPTAPPPTALPTVRIVESFPADTEPIWGPPVTMPTFSGGVAYSAPGDGEIRVELYDNLRKRINIADGSFRVRAGSGRVNFTMSPVTYEGTPATVYLQPLFVTFDAAGREASTVRGQQVDFRVADAPKILFEAGCHDPSRPGEIKFRRFDANGVQDGGAVTRFCRAAVLVDARFDAREVRMSAVPVKLWGTEIRGASLLPPRLLTPQSQLQVLELEQPGLRSPRNIDHYSVRILLRHEGTHQLATSVPIVVQVENVHIIDCEPSRVLRLQDLFAACGVEYSTWSRPRQLARLQDKGAGTSKSAEPLKIIGANERGREPDVIRFDIANLLALNSPTVGYAFYEPRPAPVNPDEDAPSSFDIRSFLLTTLSLDDVIKVVGPDKVSDFLSGSLTFVNGLGLPGKLGDTIRTAANGCAGAGPEGLLANGLMAIQGKNTDCLTKLQDAYEFLNKSKSIRAAGGPAPAFLPIGSTWVFDTPQPRNGQFAAKLTLRYSAETLPDHPDFDESKLKVVSWNPNTSELEILPTVVDLANRTATAALNQLAPNYTLAMIEPVTTTLLRSPVNVAGTGRTSGVVVNNGDTEAARFTLRSFDSGGSASGDTPVLDVPGARQNGAVTTAPAEGFTGWMEVAANRPNASGVQIVGGEGQLEILPLSNAAGSSWILSVIEENNDYGTEIHIANTARALAEVKCELRDSNGLVAGTWTGVIEPKGKLNLSASSMFPGLATPFSGYLTIFASQDVTAAALIVSDRAIDAVAGKPAPSGTGSARLFAPLTFAGLNARLRLINFDAKEATVTIRTFRADGAANAPINANLAPQAQFSADLGDVPVSVRVESALDALAGDVTMTHPRGLSRTSMPLTATGTSMVIPYVVNDGTALSTIGLSNTGTGAAAVTLTHFSADGPRTASVNLAANASSAQTLTRLFGDAAAGGYVAISSNQPLTAAAVADTRSRDLASVMAVPMPGALAAPLRPAISVSPVSLAFGGVTVGQRRELTVTLSNTGTGPLTVSSFALSNAAFSLVSPAAPLTLAPGAQQVLTIRYAPTTAAAHSGTLTIASNDPDRASLPIALTGTGTAAGSPVIDVSPTRLDFGTVASGQSRMLSVTIRNTGTAALDVNAASNSTFFPATPFTFSINPGAQQVVFVTFRPDSAAARTGTLTLTSNDASRPSIAIPMTGNDAPVNTGACPSTTNIARTGVASQSSTDFAGAASLGNNGVIDEPNGYGFHTGLEDSPWWQVDLGADSTICEVWLYNRNTYQPERARTIRVLLSTNGRDFTEVYTHDRTTWGATAAPFKITTQVANRTARYVRLQLAEVQYLHLREVEVYGRGSGTAGGTTNLLCNGSFEQPGNTTSFLSIAPGGNLPCWNVTSASVDYVGGTYWQHSNGTFSLDMDGNAPAGPGTITQSFSTVAGTAYTVSFDMATNTAIAGTKQLQVSAAGQSAVKQLTTAGRSNANMGWTAQTFTFTANSSSTTLEFKSLSPAGSPYGPALDNVCVIAGTAPCAR